AAHLAPVERLNAVLLDTLDAKTETALRVLPYGTALRLDGNLLIALRDGKPTPPETQPWVDFLKSRSRLSRPPACPAGGGSVPRLPRRCRARCRPARRPIHSRFRDRPACHSRGGGLPRAGDRRETRRGRGGSGPRSRDPRRSCVGCPRA